MTTKISAGTELVHALHRQVQSYQTYLGVIIDNYIDNKLMVPLLRHEQLSAKLLYFITITRIKATSNMPIGSTFRSTWRAN